MSRLRVIDLDEIEALQKHFNDDPEEDTEYAYFKCDDIRALLEKATPVGISAAFVEVDGATGCLLISNPDIKHGNKLYTTPQPAIPEGYALVSIDNDKE